MKCLTTTILATVLAVPMAAQAQTPYNCGTGTLRDAEAIVENLPVQMETRVKVKRNKHGEREVYTETRPVERQEKSYVIRVQLDDVVYSAESAGNFWNFDPTQLVINDPIGVCVDGRKLVIRRPDGKDYKARIVRAVRNADR